MSPSWRSTPSLLGPSDVTQESSVSQNGIPHSHRRGMPVGRDAVASRTRASKLLQRKYGRKNGSRHAAHRRYTQTAVGEAGRLRDHPRCRLARKTVKKYSHMEDYSPREPEPRRRARRGQLVRGPRRPHAQGRPAVWCKRRHTSSMIGQDGSTTSQRDMVELPEKARVHKSRSKPPANSCLRAFDIPPSPECMGASLSSASATMRSALFRAIMLSDQLAVNPSLLGCQGCFGAGN